MPYRGEKDRFLCLRPSPYPYRSGFLRCKPPLQGGPSVRRPIVFEFGARVICDFCGGRCVREIFDRRAGRRCASVLCVVFPAFEIVFGSTLRHAAQSYRGLVGRAVPRSVHSPTMLRQFWRRTTEFAVFGSSIPGQSSKRESIGIRLRRSAILAARPRSFVR